MEAAELVPFLVACQLVAVDARGLVRVEAHNCVLRGQVRCRTAHHSKVELGEAHLINFRSWEGLGVCYSEKLLETVLYGVEPCYLSKGVHIEHVVQFRGFGFEVGCYLLVEVEACNTQRSYCLLHFVRETEGE